MGALTSIFEVTINEYFVYRLSFILWRFRNLLNLLLVYFLWSGVFVGRAQLFSYTHGQLISYILVVNMIGAVVLSTKTQDLAGNILSGDIINYLLKPVHFGVYMLARELADKFLNVVLSMTEILIVIALFHPPIDIHADPQTLLWSLLFLVTGTVISFHLSTLLSLIAFWTPEVWAPRFIYMIFVTFLAGNIFPLDILPGQLYRFFMLTPFPYMVYIPSKVLVQGGVDGMGSLLTVSLSWCFLLHLLLRAVWRKGMKEFSFFGR